MTTVRALASGSRAPFSTTGARPYDALSVRRLDGKSSANGFARECSLCEVGGGCARVKVGDAEPARRSGRDGAQERGVRAA